MMDNDLVGLEYILQMVAEMSPIDTQNVSIDEKIHVCFIASALFDLDNKVQLQKLALKHNLATFAATTLTASCQSL